jgi:hypothetical protein
MSKLSWRQLNDVLCNMSEADVWGMLEIERFGEKRASVLQRLHQRYNVLRVSRERIELLKEAKNP